MLLPIRMLTPLLILSSSLMILALAAVLRCHILLLLPGSRLVRPALLWLAAAFPLPLASRRRGPELGLSCFGLVGDQLPADVW